jgi:hypothetical protein
MRGFLPPGPVVYFAGLAVTVAGLRAIRNDTKSLLLSLVDQDRRPWSARLTVITLVDVGLDSKTRRRGIRVVILGDLRSRFLLEVLRLLRREWHHLRRCRRLRCRNLFVGRPKQKFCSQRCSELIRQARFRRRLDADPARKKARAEAKKESDADALPEARRRRGKVPRTVGSSDSTPPSRGGLEGKESPPPG